MKGRDKQNRLHLIGSECQADGLGAAGTFFGQGLRKASSISLHFAGLFFSFLIVSGGCITFVLFKSCPTVQKPHKEGYVPARTQIRGSDSSFYVAARSDATCVQIAAAYFASTCRRINDRALRRLRPNGAFNTADKLCPLLFLCRDGVWGSWSPPRDLLTPGELRHWDGMHRPAVVPWEAARESLHKTDLFQRKVL